MNGKLSQDDEATTSLCPLLIISDVSLIDQAMDGEVGCVGRKADPIRNLDFPKFNGRKEELKSVTHYEITI
jgi:hypothetical protein